STSDHKNESITYQYSVVAKYNELITETVSSVALGNEETSPGSWEAFSENNTEIIEFMPSRPKEIPVIVVRPSSAINNTPLPITSFTANLAITLSHPTNYFPLVSGLMSRTYIGNGVFLPKSSTVTSRTEFAINDDVTSDNNQVLGIPLSMNPYQLYNITIFLEGNYTSSGDLNATFQGININGGNLGHIEVYSSQSSGFNDTRRWINLLVLSVSPTSYLYADIQRTDIEPGGGVTLANCTLVVELESLSINPMDYDLPDTQAWDENRLDGEIKNTDFLFEEINPAEFSSGGLDLSFILLAGIVIVGAGGAAGAFYYYRTRR
ncbi:MAG: hypothetical protein ACW98F_16860, partial [Candidatus Hodarchaeales archaeon]